MFAMAIVGSREMPWGGRDVTICASVGCAAGTSAPEDALGATNLHGVKWRGDESWGRGQELGKGTLRVNKQKTAVRGGDGGGQCHP